MKARIIFPTREQATDLAKAWTRKTLTGHTLGPDKQGGFYVELYDVTEDRAEWINQQVAKLNNQKQ